MIKKILNPFISGIRLTSRGLPHDTDAAKAFYPFDDHEIDIFSNSWGPPDKGFFVAGPGPLTQHALQKGTSKVRTTAVWSYVTLTLILILFNLNYVILCKAYMHTN